MSQEPPSSPDKGMSGARADFVASLGRRITESRDLLGRLELELRADDRDELVRRLRALGTSARLLQFPRLAQALAEAEAALDGSLSARAVQFVGRILDDLPALAWEPGATPEPAEDDAPEEPERDAAPTRVPLTVLVVGGEPIVEAMLEEGPTRSSRAVECERTDDPKAAGELARSLAPDVLVLDGALPGADELVEALSEDPLTEPMPVVVVGALSKERAARFLALGVQRTLTAPLSGDALVRTCEELSDQRHGRTARIPLGEPTVEQLGQRLADEVYRALVTGVAPQARAEHVALGEGAEVLAAIWGAIARVREIVTVRTGGAVRFAQLGPEGAMALAPWLDPEAAGADRTKTRGRGAAADVRLEGRRVVVADDDPGVTWYIADLLRTTGCVVHEALDGRTALELAQRVTPDLVVSDILMPELDGFALCRALRRDVALRDVPVILLSWKEDLLQRVRELGASAAAYMRKESDARAILARVREVLWPRARLEARLKGPGEVRGRLEGITARTLLELVGGVRGTARVSVRDATSLYEIEVQNGAPRRALVTSGEGSFARGERVLAAMLGVGAGRFAVGPGTPGLTGELTGTLSSLLERPIAAARGAMAAISGAKGVAASRVVFDPDALETYLAATPEPTRGLVVRLAQGASPRDLLLAGAVPAALLEDVLGDLAARGAVVGVSDDQGADLLGPEVDDALAVLRAAPPRTMPQRAPSRPPSKAPSKAPSRPPTSARPAVPALGPEAAPKVPASLADAVMREVSERATGTATPVPPPSPIVDPDALKPRSNPPEETVPFELVRASHTDLEPAPLERTEVESSVALSDSDLETVAGPPTETTEEETVYEANVPSAEPAPASPAPPSPAPASPALALAEPAAPARSEERSEDGRAGAETAAPEEEEPDEESPEPARPVVAKAKPKPAEAPRAEAKTSSTGLGWFLLLAVLIFGGVFAKLAMAPAPGGPAYLDPPPGAELAPGAGMLEITAPAGADIVVDGTPRGRGRLVFTLPGGPHEVRAAGRVRTVDVAPGRLLKVDLASP